MPKLLNVTEVVHLVNLSRTRIYALMNTGEFPRPIRIGQRAVRWRESDLKAWIDSRPMGGTAA